MQLFEAKKSLKVAKSLSFAPKPMLQIWCIELAYDAPYMVYFGAWTLKKFSKKRLFEKLLKNVQLRARASACTRVRVRVQLCV